MITKPIKVPLNVHLESMVTPKSCLLGYYNEFLGSKTAPFLKYCNDCEYRVRENCVYIKRKVDVASGSYQEDDRDYHYVQFCCGRCGELIQLKDKISYIYYNLSRDTHYCKHCKTPHRYLSNENEKYIFAIPVKEGSK